MVNRYKILVACVFITFAVIWLKHIDYFPISQNAMYSVANRNSLSTYFQVRDPDGKLIGDNTPFYIAPSLNGDEVAGKGCWDYDQDSNRYHGCIDFFTLVARWVQQPVTIERWQWDYATGERTRLQSLTISP
ncbi:MAG: hypothetical protein ABI700_17585 [Chloroflexota bacterium]